MDEPRESSVAERYRLLLDLFVAGEEIMRQNLRRRTPEATEREIEERLVAWLHERPGAELGDAIGRAVAWPRAR
jgi:hypothetical protein